MRADDAKKLPLDQILSSLGFSPIKSQKNGQELWYASPFRQEKDASFHISAVTHSRLGRIWVWKDFGDMGGNVIDFAIRYYGLAANDVSGALARLDRFDRSNTKAKDHSPTLPLFSAPVEPESEAPACPFTDVQIELLTNRRLIGYLAGRRIDASIARQYLRQVSYNFDGRHYLALAFPNNYGGYEMRSTGCFKGTLPPKGITLLHPEKSELCKEVTVFEGFTDYLSALTYYKRTEATTPVIVLNSASMQEQAIEAIKQLGAEKVHLYLDRDTTGRKLNETFKEALSGIDMVDQSNLYADHKDFNEFLAVRTQGKSR